VVEPLFTGWLVHLSCAVEGIEFQPDLASVLDTEWATSRASGSSRWRSVQILGAPDQCVPPSIILLASVYPISPHYKTLLQNLS